MDSLSITPATQAIKRVLEEAISNRGKYYAHYHTVTMRYKDDDTRADRDSQHFQSIVKMLGLPQAQEIVLPNKPAG